VLRLRQRALLGAALRCGEETAHEPLGGLVALALGVGAADGAAEADAVARVRRLVGLRAWSRAKAAIAARTEPRWMVGVIVDLDGG
jgi:hypothetical protein